MTVSRIIETDWLKWMNEIHIPDVIKTGYFFKWEIEKQLLPEDSLTETTYIINYFAKSLADFQQYSENDAPRLRNDHNEKFKGKFKASRIVTSVLSK